MCVWVVDADRLDINNGELQIIYRNARVDNYLNSNSQLGIVSPKGIGKTFLLKIKRKATKIKASHVFRTTKCLIFRLVFLYIPH